MEKIKLEAFLCGVGTCVEMILDLLDYEDEENTETEEPSKIEMKEISTNKAKKIIDILKED